MRSLHRASRLVAVWLFSAGFVLVGSGWGPALARMMSPGPAWSVCGQALCECLPFDVPDDCPLCVAGVPMPGDAGCANSEPEPDATRLLIRRTDSPAAMTRLHSAGHSLLVGCFLIGMRAHAEPIATTAQTRRTLEAWRLPPGDSRDVPTPPPRA